MLRVGAQRERVTHFYLEFWWSIGHAAGLGKGMGALEASRAWRLNNRRNGSTHGPGQLF